MAQRILIIGAAGRIGRMLRPRMACRGRTLRLLDAEPIQRPQQPDGGEHVRADVTDMPTMTEACQDADAVIHLAALSGEADWETILRVNIHGTYTVLEAARRAGVPRVILASSNHAVGFHPIGDEACPDYLFPRPDTFYGVSKAADEALGSLYHDRHGMDVLCVRIGSANEQPPNVRGLGTWLSPDDCARLMEALLATPQPGFRVVWGVSANRRNPFSLAEARALGYRPQDDSERYAHLVPGSEAEPPDERIGGGWAVGPGAT
ncbi:NAD-dependent epimerase/dehydratase family protein [Haloechinothrix alba]|nr:NAD(P)-dependent oxidoreductase [Haloechinothrix alba]